MSTYKRRYTPEPRRVKFSPELLYGAVDRKRHLNGLNWTDVCRQTGEYSASSSIARMRKGYHPSVDLLVRLMQWLEVTDISRFTITIPTDE